MTDRFGPEISDVIVDYDPTTLERRPIQRADALARLAHRSARRVASSLAAPNGVLDPAEVDGMLVRSHLELQRLHEEFRVGTLVRMLIAPMIALARQAVPERPIRIVDVGCGLGFVTRWLAACGQLGDDVELIGVDYNRALVAAAGKLAADEKLPCRFEAANAFRLDVPSHIYFSTGVLHHFRGADLGALFSEHARANAFGFVHVDIRPSPVAPLGSWIFHRSRMREPLAQWDGYWSAVRAHDAATLVSAVRAGAPEFATSTIDAHPGIYMLVRIFQAVLGVRADHAAALASHYAPLGKRYQASP